jgi:hypothetical protein
LLLAAVVTTIAARLPVLSADGDPRLTEYQVKAAYLYNFVRFIEWPPEALPPPGEPFVVAILGDDPFGTVLDRAFTGKLIADRPATVVRLREPGDALRAQIVFISASESGALARIATTPPVRGMLTVGDIPEMAREGAIIAFRIEGNKVRFDINLRQSDRAGLKLSSQLLKVATIVGEER